MVTSSGTPNFTVPSELELTEVFGSEPRDARPKDGFWSFEARDSNGVTLRLSFDIFERSIQTVLLIDDDEAARISQEGAISLRVVREHGEDVLRGECLFRDARSTVEIRLRPRIVVTWGTIRTE